MLMYHGKLRKTAIIAPVAYGGSGEIRINDKSMSGLFDTKRRAADELNLHVLCPSEPAEKA